MIRDIIADATRSASLSPRVEVPGLVEGSQERPGYVLLPGYPMGRDSLVDVTLINPLQQSAWPEAAHMARVTMEKDKMKKRDQYRGKLLPNQVFKPMVFETLGGKDVEAVLLLKKITTITA